jgi:hypothetical protein
MVTAVCRSGCPRYVVSLGISLRASDPARYQSTSRRVANEWPRSSSLGPRPMRRCPGSVRIPMAEESLAKVRRTEAPTSLLPRSETKKALVMRLGQVMSRDPAYSRALGESSRERGRSGIPRISSHGRQGPHPRDPRRLHPRRAPLRAGGQ